MDEPTTGMDSATATRIVTIVRKLTQRERTIIITIHQPNAEIFRIMDQLMILSMGKVVYFVSHFFVLAFYLNNTHKTLKGHAHKATEYFSAEGLVCPIHDNPLDYFMKILTPENFLIDPAYNHKELEGSPAKLRKMLEDRVEMLSQKEIATRVPMTYPFSQPTRLTVHNLKHFYFMPTWWTQFWVLYKRANIQHIRSYFRIIMKIVGTFTIILFGSFLYYGVLFFLPPFLYSSRKINHVSQK